jgi:hypothetical protein
VLHGPYPWCRRWREFAIHDTPFDVRRGSSSGLGPRATGRTGNEFGLPQLDKLVYCGHISCGKSQFEIQLVEECCHTTDNPNLALNQRPVPWREVVIWLCQLYAAS